MSFLVVDYTVTARFLSTTENAVDYSMHHAHVHPKAPSLRYPPPTHSLHTLTSTLRE